jgi:hypothetical protein
MYQQVKDPVSGAISATLIRRVTDGAFIPADEQNADYRDYLAWIAGGNELAPAADPEPVRERTPAEKLVAAGLTVAELKTLLGLQ